MKALLKLWNQLGARYAALSQREKRLCAAAVVLAPVLAGYALLVEPQLLRVRNAQRALDQQQATIQSLKSQLANLQDQSRVDPDAAKNAELATIKEQVAAADKRLKALQGTLVAPEDVSHLLERLLARHANLRLVSLKTLAPESIVPAQQSADGKPVPVRQFDIYRHGVELRLEGGYLELLAYLDQLEKADKKLLWGGVQFSVIEYPKSQLIITVYTLGSEQAWLIL